MTAVTLAVAATLLTAGCTIGGRPDREQDATPKQTQGQDAVGEAAQGQPAELGPVVATREVQLKGNGAGDIVPIKVELYGLRRDQGFVTVRVRMTNMSPDPELDWQISSDFQGDAERLNSGSSFSGVYLLDKKNRKQYLVARTANQEYLASTDLGAVFVEPRQAVDLFATFGAPPDDVRTVDIFIPRIPVIENVPLG